MLLGNGCPPIRQYGKLDTPRTIIDIFVDGYAAPQPEGEYPPMVCVYHVAAPFSGTGEDYSLTAVLYSFLSPPPSS